MKYNGHEMRQFLQTIVDDKTLSQRLDIVQAQIPIAHENGYTESLNNLMDHEQAIIDRRLDLMED